MAAIRGSYKGNATLELTGPDVNGRPDKYPFSFGLKKARLIMAHINEIRAFVESEASKGAAAGAGAEVQPRAERENAVLIDAGHAAYAMERGDHDMPDGY